MAVNTQEQFFEVLAETKLLSKERLTKAKRVAEGKTEPTTIARALVRKGLLSRWQAAQILSEKFPSYLGKYRLLDMLESGETGAVYLAEHEQMNRRVFLKTVTRKRGDNGDSVQDFLKDARSLATLDHRNLIHVYDVDKEDASFYLVMEHIDGEDLQKIVNRDGPLPFDRAASYVAQAASGLAHAHEQGIHHHGIKPDRLIVDEKGELKILDIGVARLVDPDEETTGRASNQSRPEDVDYVAPEQATGRNKVDQRADIYSLGCLFYFLLTGHAPYPEGTTDERLKARIRKSPPSVLDERADAPAEFAEACARMMATQPRDRLTAADVANRLQEWMKVNQPTRSKPARPEADKPAPRPGRGSSGEMRRSSDDLTAAAAAAVKADSDRPSSRRTKPAKANEESSDAPVVEPVEKKKIPLPLIIAAAGGGVALVAAIVVAAIVLGSRPTEATSNGDGNASTAATVPAERNEEKFDVVTPDDVLFGPADLRLTVIDGTCNVKGDAPDKATYTIVAKVDKDNLTGFRLDELAGLASHGGFQISEVEAFAVADKGDRSAAHRLPLGAASDERGPADDVLDRNMVTGWSPSSPQGSLIVLFAAPVKLADVNPGKDSYWLRIAIHQEAGGQQTLGKFRVAARTGGETPGPRPPVDLSASPTLAYWRFEDGTAGQVVRAPPTNEFQAAAKDVSNHDNDLFARDAGSAPSSSAEVDAPTVRGTGEENKLCLDTTVAPAEGQSARFLVTNPSLAKPTQDVGLMPLSEWTVEAAFRLNELAGRHVILCKTGQPTSLSEPPFELAVDADAKHVRVTTIDQSGAKRTAQSNEQLALQAGFWYHVAAVCDGKNIRLLVDAPGDGQGYLEQESAECKGGLIDSFGDWSIGRGCAAGEPAGNAVALIDEVRISAAALPDDKLLYHGTPEQLEAEKSGPAPTAVATTNGDGNDVPAASDVPIKFHDIKVTKAPVAGQGKTEAKISKPDANGWMVVSSLTSDKIIYHVDGETDQKDMTGVRLEVGPAGDAGPGLGENGKFVLTDFKVEIADAADAKNWASINFAKKSTGLPEDASGNPFASNWTVSDKNGHWAMFFADKPFGFDGKTFMRIHLHHADGGKTAIARFRLSAITGNNTESGDKPGARMLAEVREGNPFIKTATVVGLPLIKPDEPLSEDDLLPVSLGNVFLGPDDALVPTLVGGESGHGAPGAFSLIDGEPAERPDQTNWEIQYIAGGSAPTNVARLFRIADGFAFVWKKEAEKILAANYLRNCALNLRVGADFHTVLFRSSVDNEPMKFSFSTERKQKIEPFRAAIAYPPSGDKIQIEFQMSCGNPDNVDFMPKHAFDPSNTMPAKKGSVTMALGESGSLRVGLESTWDDEQGLFEITRQRPAIRPKGAERDQDLNLAKLQSTAARFEPIVANAPRALELVKEHAKKEPDKPDEKKKLAAAKAFLGQTFRTVEPEKIEPQLAKMTEAMDFVNEIRTAMEEFDDELDARIEMRVFALADTTQIELLRTTGWKDQPAEKKEE